MQNKRIFLTKLCFLLFGLFATESVSANLSCSITTDAACLSPSVVVLRMSAATNAHSELPSGSTAAYSSNVLCCIGGTGLGNSCSGNFAVVAKLAAVTNSHVQQGSQSGYANNACLSVSSGTVSIVYGANCSGFDTTIASTPTVTNSHIGGANDYANKICGTVTNPQTLSFSISANSLGFGTLSTANSRYATSDGLGNTVQTIGHSISVSTNAASGYSVAIQGATLTSGALTIAPIGTTNTAASVGSSQFGIHLSSSGGTGAVTSPYAAAGFAYAANATTPSLIASEVSGDGITTTYSVTYLANISTITTSASYSSKFTYQVTANF